MYFRFYLSEIHSSLEETVEFAREWLENELQVVFYKHKNTFMNRKNTYFTLKDVDIAFLAGGTCRIPFFKNFIKELSPKMEIIMDGELEIITATGAAIHALQVLNNEVEPYIKFTKDGNGKYDFNNEESERRDNYRSNSDDNLHANEKIITKQDELSTEFHDESFNRKKDVLDTAFDIEKKTIPNQYESNITHHSELEEIESSVRNCGKKSDDSEFDEQVETKHDQLTAPPSLESSSSEGKFHHSATDAESLQEGLPEEKLSLP